MGSSPTEGVLFLGVKVADVTMAFALVVQIAAAWVRVPRVAATKIDIGNVPCTAHDS